MIPQEILKKIRRIEIRTSHMVNDVLAGQYHSAFKGRGMEFEEVREYQWGDDARTIDWNVSARYGEPFVKVFREERELTVLILADLSGSQWFGTVSQLKRDLMAEVGATLAYSAIRNNDKVGLVCFTDQVEKVVPARKGTRHVLRVIRELLFYQPASRGTNLAIALDHLNRTVKRRAVVFVISDFLNEGYDNALRIARRRHDIIPIVVTDAAELDLPNVGLIELADAESDSIMLCDTSNRRTREEFRRRTAEYVERRNLRLRQLDIETVQVRTGESFVEPLTRFFRAREVRR